MNKPMANHSTAAKPAVALERYVLILGRRFADWKRSPYAAGLLRFNESGFS